MDIKQLREHERLTQSQLALIVGVSTGYISHLETGKRVNPSLPVMLRLAEALNVTVNDLLDQRPGKKIEGGHRNGRDPSI